ncbi:MAG: uroporphyrinogen decarboxylase family protein [Spirochaetota bacterium]
MTVIAQLLDEFGALCDSAENARRLALWEQPARGIRGETQWHGVPNFEVGPGRPAPLTAECLERMWVAVLGMDIRRFYTDPVYFLEFYLRFKILKFRRFADDTPLTRQIPVCFGVTHEAGMLGQKIHFLPGEEPQFGRDPVFGPTDELPKTFDFSKNEYLRSVAIPYHKKVKELAGREFQVQFPQWYRGPQGVALYVRGFENFSLDLYDDPAFAHRTLRYVTDAAKAFARWRADYCGEPIEPCDLFNDDMQLMGPEFYGEFFLPYEQELSDFHGGVAYWHSCGDVTKHVPEVCRLRGIGLLDFGVTMESKEEGMKGLPGPQVLELRVFAKPHIQEASEADQKAYVRGIVQACARRGIRKYVIRTSGMSTLLGGERDIGKLARWVELAREVQAEGPA